MCYYGLMRKMMRYRAKPVHLVVDGLPAHKTKLVKDYVQSTQGRLTLHVLPRYTPELSPDEAVWSYMKRTGVARAPLRKGERLRDKLEEQLATIEAALKLIRSFFRAPSVAYITDCCVKQRLDRTACGWDRGHFGCDMPATLIALPITVSCARFR
jgi:transposase